MNTLVDFVERNVIHDINNRRQGETFEYVGAICVYSFISAIIFLVVGIVVRAVLAVGTYHVNYIILAGTGVFLALATFYYEKHTFAVYLGIAVLGGILYTVILLAAAFTTGLFDLLVPNYLTLIEGIVANIIFFFFIFAVIYWFWANVTSWT